MKERQKRIMKRLLIEELERRALLSAGSEIAMAATGLTNSSVEDFYRSQVGTEAGGAAGTGMFDDNIGPVARDVMTSTANLNTSAAASASAEATTGVGQMVITTGANTPGIGSFAMPIAGPSRAGGTGDPRLPLVGTDHARLPTVSPQVAAATDAALQSLDAEPRDEFAEEIARLSEPQKTSRQAKTTQPTARRAWSAATSGTEAWDSREAEPAGASR